MNARIKISLLLAGVGLILAFLPFNAAKSFQLKPTELLRVSLNSDMFFSVDEVARFVNNEDTSIQLIDLRSASEFMESNIPGSINIPFNDLLNPSWEGYLNQDKVRNVYYAISQ